MAKLFPTYVYCQECGMHGIAIPKQRFADYTKLDFQQVEFAKERTTDPSPILHFSKIRQMRRMLRNHQLGLATGTE